jgi:6-pyruvoyl-tetrahydropterin synthase
VGFVLDYGELNFVKEYVDGLDHQHLNDIFSFNPTSENICKEIFLEIEEALNFRVADHITHMAVELSETPKTNARYERALA